MKSEIRQKIEEIAPHLKNVSFVYVDGYDTKGGRRYRMKWSGIRRFTASEARKIMELPHVRRVKYSTDGRYRRSWSEGPVVLFNIPPKKIKLSPPIPDVPSKDSTSALDLAKRIVGKDPSVDAILKEIYTDQELGIKPIFPKSYEEVKDKSGWKFDTVHKLVRRTYGTPLAAKTVSQAHTSEVYKVLTQVMAEYLGDWIPDWKDSKQEKYCIDRVGDDLVIESHYRLFSFFAFPDRETCEEFLENFREVLDVFYQIAPPSATMSTYIQ